MQHIGITYDYSADGKVFDKQGTVFLFMRDVDQATEILCNMILFKHPDKQIILNLHEHVIFNI